MGMVLTFRIRDTPSTVYLSPNIQSVRYLHLIPNSMRVKPHLFAQNTLIVKAQSGPNDTTTFWTIAPA